MTDFLRFDFGVQLKTLLGERLPMPACVSGRAIRCNAFAYFDPDGRRRAFEHVRQTKVEPLIL